MPGEDGEQLFKDYPLSGQSVVARAHGREGGKAGKGTPKTGGVGQGGEEKGEGGQGDAKHGEGGQGGAKHGEDGQGGSPLAYRRHADPTGLSCFSPSSRRCRGVEGLSSISLPSSSSYIYGSSSSSVRIGCSKRSRH
jgi:hypothetical protein